MRRSIAWTKCRNTRYHHNQRRKRTVINPTWSLLAQWRQTSVRSRSSPVELVLLSVKSDSLALEAPLKFGHSHEPCESSSWNHHSVLQTSSNRPSASFEGTLSLVCHTNSASPLDGFVVSPPPPFPLHKEVKPGLLGSFVSTSYCYLTFLVISFVFDCAKTFFGCDLELWKFKLIHLMSGSPSCRRKDWNHTVSDQHLFNISSVRHHYSKGFIEKWSQIILQANQVQSAFLCPSVPNRTKCKLHISPRHCTPWVYTPAGGAPRIKGLEAVVYTRMIFTLNRPENVPDKLMYGTAAYSKAHTV